MIASRSACKRGFRHDVPATSVSRKSRLEAVGEAFVIEAEQMQDRGVQIIGNEPGSSFPAISSVLPW
jgi:hypothetical protein